MTRRWLPGGLCWALLLAIGCDRQVPTSQPSQSRTPAKQPPKTVTPAWLEWSREDALAKLRDETTAVQAAARLVQLEHAGALVVAGELNDRSLALLRLVPLDEGARALGFATEDERVIRAAILISAEGDITRPTVGAEEELASLFVSRESAVFPHLIVTPERVLAAKLPVETAIELETPEVAYFAYEDNQGVPYVALRPLDGTGTEEATRYRWDPYELSFLGPAMDVLAEDTELTFKIDLPRSELLTPMGGKIESPDLPEPTTKPSDEEPPIILDERRSLPT